MTIQIAFYIQQDFDSQQKKFSIENMILCDVKNSFELHFLGETILGKLHSQYELLGR